MQSKKNTILLVDDDPLILESLTRLLKLNGLESVTATSGAQALEILKTRRFPLIVSDHRMPDMTGLELMLHIKRKYPDVLRVLLTAFSEKNMIQKAINQGEIYRFFTKPFDETELISDIKKGLDLQVESGAEQKKIRRQLDRSNFETVMALAEAIELKDQYTKGHCSRVRSYSLQMAKAIGLQADLRSHLIYGALLHDCGKIGVAEDILLNRGGLTTTQRKIMEHHTIQGFELTHAVRHLKTASIFIRQHHERWDGQGYPDGLAGEQIHLCSRIIAIADTFDAMTSDRPYRRGMDREQARQLLLEGRGTQFDPDLVGVFVRILDREQTLEEGHPEDNRAVILILSGVDQTLSDLNSALGHSPYQILTASDPVQALTLLERTSVDIICCDEQLPGITGIQFLNTLQRKHPKVIRMMLCNHTSPGKAMTIINQGGIHKLVAVPWRNKELNATIKNALEWRRMRKEVSEPATEDNN